MTPAFAFWYVYASNGTDGFLLDLVRRPDQGLARLAIFHQGRPPRIVRHGFSGDEVRGVPGELGVRIGSFALDALGCRGPLLDARFALSAHSMRFVPGWVAWWFGRVPDFRSRYGVLGHAVCDGAEFANAPLICSTYILNNIAAAQWVLVSAPRFEGTDFAFEISAARLLGRWMPAAWVFLEGREYRLGSVLDSLVRVHIHRAGDLEGGERVFSATIRGHSLAIDIEARGDAAEFARLEAEGQTEIHTTLFGTCRATVAGQTFTARRTCLLELKN